MEKSTEGRKKSTCILIVDDSSSIRTMLSLLLKKKVGGIIEVAVDGEEALLFLKYIRPDLVISDIEMPKINGLDLSEAIKNSKIPIFLMSGLHYEDIKGRLNSSVKFFSKPLDFNRLFQEVIAVI